MPYSITIFLKILNRLLDRVLEADRCDLGSQADDSYYAYRS